MFQVLDHMNNSIYSFLYVYFFARLQDDLLRISKIWFDYQCLFDRDLWPSPAQFGPDWTRRSFSLRFLWFSCFPFRCRSWSGRQRLGQLKRYLRGRCLRTWERRCQSCWRIHPCFCRPKIEPTCRQWHARSNPSRIAEANENQKIQIISIFQELLRCTKLEKPSHGKYLAWQSL